MVKKLFSYSLILILGNTSLKSQNNVLYKLQKQLLLSKTDTAKVNCLNNIAQEFLSFNNDSAISVSNKALKIAQSSNYIVGKTKAYINLINAYRHIDSTKKSLSLVALIDKENFIAQIANPKEQNKTRADWLYAKARLYENLDSLEYAKKMYKQSVAICESQQYYYLQAKNYIGLKFISGKQNNFKDALEYSFKSILPLEIIADSAELCHCYNGISHFYGQLNEHEKANKYRETALSLAFKINRLDLASLIYCNIGIGFHELGYKNPRMYDSALLYANKSLQLAQQINHTKRKITALSLIGSCYLNTNQFQKSLETLHQGLALANTLNDNYYKISISDHIGELYQKNGKLDSAIYYGQKSFAYAKELNLLTQMQWAAETLSKSYQLNGDFKKAFEMQALFYSLRDSTQSQENQKELINQELKYKYDKLAVADSLKYDAETKIKEFKTQEVLKTERNKLTALSFGLAFAVILGSFAFNRYRVAQKQKLIIEKQKQSIEDKSKEIQASILYSKEIQNVFLKELSNNTPFFKSASLIYKPKDIVSGDFYWHKEIGDNLFIAVGDCTGHGVPGAIISVLAIQSLEKTIPAITNINELHQLNVLIRNDFNVYYQKNRRVSVGLDYSVICINKKERQVYITGSGCSVITTNKTNELTSLRFSSINIGGTMPIIYEPQTFCYSFENIKQVLLFTDGIVDQRGGTQNKKLGSRDFIKKLEKLENSTSQLEIFVNEWVGENEQLDDITILLLNI